MSNPKVRVPIVDKNGRHTTVIRRVDNATTKDRVAFVAPLLHRGSSSGSAAGSVLLEGYNFEMSEIFEDVIATDDGDTMSAYSDEFDDVKQRVPYLAGEDGIAAVAVKSSAGLYDVTLTSFDGNRGNYRSIDVSYTPKEPSARQPTVGDVVTALTINAQIAARYPNNGDGLDSFVADMSYGDVESASRDLGYAHEASTSLKALVGNVRYGDYVYGRDKADYGYDSGITYFRE